LAETASQDNGVRRMTKMVVLGLGSIGLRHAQNFWNLGVPICGYDPDSGRCNLAERAGIETTSNREEAFSGADAVVIASPSGCHYDDLAESLDRNLHVFAEKPLAHTDVGLSAFLSGFEEKNLIVFGGFNMRYHPAFVAARKMVADDKLGEILWARFQMSDYLPNWRPHTDYRTGYANNPVSGGVLLDVIHEFDAANALLGPAETIAAVARKTGSLELASEDCADVLLQHKSNVVSAIHVDFVTRPGNRHFEIAGTEGRLRVDLNARNLKFTDKSGSENSQAFAGSSDDDYMREAEDFLHCIETGSEPACNGREALAVLQQVLAARQLAALPKS